MDGSCWRPLRWVRWNYRCVRPQTVLVYVYKAAKRQVELTVLTDGRHTDTLFCTVLYCTAVQPINKTSPAQMLVIGSTLKLRACARCCTQWDMASFYRAAERPHNKEQSAALSAEQTERVNYSWKVSSRLRKEPASNPVSEWEWNCQQAKLAKSVKWMVKCSIIEIRFTAGVGAPRYEEV
jgi:hypothetical protein